MNDVERLAEVRRRCVTALWKGTGADSPQWWSCRLCNYVWRDGTQETHGAGCPLPGLAASTGKAVTASGNVVTEV